jgi:hypothetical protein
MRLLGGEGLPKKYRIWLLLEVVVLCVLLIIVWGLLTIPVIIFFNTVVSLMSVFITGDLALLYMCSLLWCGAFGRINGVWMNTNFGMPLAKMQYVSLVFWPFCGEPGA